MKRDASINKIMPLVAIFALLTLSGRSVADTADYADTIASFRKSPQSAHFFSNSYGYAVFPTVTGAGFFVGAAHGKGRVYVHDQPVGSATITRVSAGLQAGGKAYSQIIFFETKSALDMFESGSFEFGAGASAVAITAGNADVKAHYVNSLSVFTLAKGGLMYEASVVGQKINYTAGPKP